MSDSNGQFEKQAGPVSLLGRAAKSVGNWLGKHPYIASGLGTGAAWDAWAGINNPDRDRLFEHIPLVPIKGDSTGVTGLDWDRLKTNFLTVPAGMGAALAARGAITGKLPNAKGAMKTLTAPQRAALSTAAITGTTVIPLAKHTLVGFDANNQAQRRLAEAQTEVAKAQLRELKSPTRNTPTPPVEPTGKNVNITGTLTTNIGGDIATTVSAPAVEKGLNNVADATHSVADAAAKAQKEAPKPNNPTVPQKVDTTVTVKNDWMPWVAGAIGAGALGIGGAALYRYLTTKDRGQGAKIQYRMEGKKGDPWSEALVDVPIRTPRLSPKVKETLESGLKRQVSKNIKYMSTKRDPNTGKRISYEDWQRLYGEEEDSAEKTPDKAYTDKLNKKYEKAASTREWAEGSGSVLNAALLGGAGAMAGQEIAKKLGKNSLYGALLGGAAGAAPSIIGSLLGHAIGDRTPAAQLKHDDKGAGPEFLVPGYAMYNAARRNPRAIQMLTPALQEAYKGEDDDEDDWEDDDFDKEASALPPAPPSNQPQAQPGPPPQTPLPRGGAPVTPNTTGPAQGPGDAANARPADPSANKALSAINSIGGMLGVQVNPSATQKQMV